MGWYVSSLDNDYYRFDQVGQRLIGESVGEHIAGRPGRVRVEAVEYGRRRKLTLA